jgi:hypothetical protein
MAEQQPVALALADYLDLPHISQHKSAAELRRLHAVEKESHEIIDQLEKAIDVLAAQTESTLSVFESLPADWQQKIEAMKVDAERWRHYRECSGDLSLRLHNSRPDMRDNVIDAAMRDRLR